MSGVDHADRATEASEVNGRGKTGGAGADHEAVKHLRFQQQLHNEQRSSPVPQSCLPHLTRRTSL